MQYKISVVIPVYNVENYLDETINCIIHQDIGFAENIQLILINDGSSDGSEEVCLKYQRLYPDNIIYKRKENGGVSSARNFGIKFIKGKYVNFLDSDDKWELDSFSKAYKFFEEHYEQIDVLAGRIQFFEAKSHFHPLDYKFKQGTRVLSIEDEKEIQSVQSTVATTFIKTEAIGDLRFDENVEFGEDSIFVNSLIIKKKAYGVIEEALYSYRSRNDESSAVQGQTKKKGFYIDTVEKYYLGLGKKSIDMYGYVIPYIQAVIAYDLEWRILNKDYLEVLNSDEQKIYLEKLKEAIRTIDDSIFLRSKAHQGIYKKKAVIELKNNVNFFRDIHYNEEKGALFYGEYNVVKLRKNKKSKCKVDFVDIKDGKLCVELCLAKWIFECTSESPRLILKFNEKEIQAQPLKYSIIKNVTDTGEVEDYYSRFYCEFSLEECMREKQIGRFKPVLYFGDEQCDVAMRYGKFLTSTDDYPIMCRLYPGYYVKLKQSNIQVGRVKNKAIKRIKLEIKSSKHLISIGKEQIAFQRMQYFRFQKKEEKKGKIWLVTDRADNAGDNGEVFFRYLCKNKPEGVRPIFVIGKGAECVPRLQSIGETIFFEDKEYPFYFLMSEKIISSTAGEFLINPFGEDKCYFTDLMHFEYYYLQHGVACADLSSWLNRFNKNIHMFFTSGNKERNSIIEGDYYYNEEQVVLTGQARFDALYNNRKKQILILPTWRRYIKESYDETTTSVYFAGFKDTEYFKFYNNLINHERLLRVMREYGYTGLFCLHPIHKEQAVDYEGNDVFKVNQGYVDYNLVFAESAVMVTDYSSVLFDFAYLRKPVIYTQFDKEQFFKGQIYDEGYFSYEKDGFGPVCYDMEETVDNLIKLIESGCENDSKYLERENRFFAFDDQNNCKRIYDAIVAEK